MKTKAVLKKGASAPYRKRKIRIGFIGFGNIAQAHLKALAMIPEAEVVAVCDINPQRLDVAKEQLGITKLYEKWDDMFRAVKLDAVLVCTYNSVHCAASIAALNAGCHVLTEKPMALNAKECEKMVAAARKNNRILCVGFQFRYNPKIDFFTAIRDAGDIGDILEVRVKTLRRSGIPPWGVFCNKELQGGGALVDIGVHVIEAAHYCMGAPEPIAASGKTWTYLGDKPIDVLNVWGAWDHTHYTVEDLAAGQVRFANGALMQIEASFAAHIKENQWDFEIKGTKGGFKFSTGEAYMNRYGYMINITPGYLPDSNFDDMFYRKLRAFVSSCLYGEPLRATGEDGLAVQKILDGIYRSAEQDGKEVAIR